LANPTHLTLASEFSATFVRTAKAENYFIRVYIFVLSILFYFIFLIFLFFIPILTPWWALQKSASVRHVGASKFFFIFFQLSFLYKIYDLKWKVEQNKKPYGSIWRL